MALMLRISGIILLVLLAVAGIRYWASPGGRVDQWSAAVVNPVLAQLLYVKARATDPGIEREPIVVSRPNLDLKVVAHGTATKWAPANTVENYQLAIEQGVDFIEMDIRVSGDGVPIVFHNSIVSISTDGKGVVAELSLAELQELRLLRNPTAGYAKGMHAGAKIPTLREALELVHGKTCVIWEMKAPPTRAVVQLFQEFNFSPGCLYVFAGIEYGLQDSRLLMLQYLWPEAPLVVGLTDPGDIDGLLQRFPYLQGVLKFRRLDSDLVDAAHAKGLVVFSQLLDEQFDGPAGYARAVEAGFDLVMVDNYDVLVEWLQSLRRQAELR